MKKFLAMLLALVMVFTCFALTACGDDEQTEDPGNEDPGTEDPGTEDPGTTDPGTTDPSEPSDEDKQKAEEEAAQKAAEEAAAPVIETLQGLTSFAEITADNYEDAKAKYDAANDAYNDLDKAAKTVVGSDNKKILADLKTLIKNYETKLEAEKALTEYYVTLGALPTIKIANATLVLDGELDDSMAHCTSMTLTKEQCDAWNAEGRTSVDGAGVVGDTTLTEGAETDISFYFAYDDNYFYIVEWRCDLNWCFSAQDYKKSYTGDGSLLWLVNTGEAAEWLASGSMASSPACGMMWNAGVGGEKPGENAPQIALYPKDDQSNPIEKTASGEWNYCLKWDDSQYYYTLEVAIPWADLPFTAADVAAGNISATFCSVDIVNPEFDGDTGKLWTGMGYQMQYPGVNKWHLAEPLVVVK